MQSDMVCKISNYLQFTINVVYPLVNILFGFFLGLFH